MKRLFQMKGERILGLFLSSCLIISGLGGCSAKLIYQVMNNNPMWLNTVVVAMFEGLFFCSGGFMGLLASRKLYKQPNSFDSKVRAVFIFLFLGIPPIILGLFILRIAMWNLMSFL